MKNKILLLSILLVGSLGCSTFFTFPDEYTQKERFQFFQNDHAPVKNDLKIYWETHSIPFIEAQNDHDLAFAVGMVHAHLRVDQIELLRYVSQGRLSEIAGPIPRVKELDHMLRLLNFKRAAKKSIQKMSPESREWMQNFTKGVNWYIGQMKKTSFTERFINREIKPYTLIEMVTISKLVSSDLTWAVYLKYLRVPEKKDRDKLFDYYLQKRKTDTFSYNNTQSKENLAMMSNWMKYFSKSGSNSVVVSGKKTKTGAAMIANDPHVGLFLPNFWILIGMKSPSYHAVGYMISGVPIIGVGRNRDIAWGGTNMRGISSHLYDVTHFPKKDIKVRKEKIRRRWWFDTSIEIRETPYGPILSDNDFFDKENLKLDASLYWIGSQGSDEVKTFLCIARAKNWQEFHSAFKDYRVSAMNMTYADTKGNIGMVAAYGQPVLKDPQKTLEFIKKTNNPVIGVIKPTDHPNPYNPQKGYIGSANNKPFSKPMIPFSFGYANNDRIDRIQSIMEQKKTIYLKDLMVLQQDVFSEKAFEIKSHIEQKLKNRNFDKEKKLYNIMESWDGNYYSKSKGALLFELTMYFVWQKYISSEIKDDTLKKDMKSYPDWKTVLYNWIQQKNENELYELIKTGLQKAKPFYEEYKNWGGYTLQAQTTLYGMVPLIGKRFKYKSFPVSGSSDTLNKYGRKFSTDKDEVFYGASARHISDMSSLDENYFIMNGGQDSWIMNENINDQIELWRKGEYIKIPLNMDKVRKKFDTHIQNIHPMKK